MQTIANMKNITKNILHLVVPMILLLTSGISVAIDLTKMTEAEMLNYYRNMDFNKCKKTLPQDLSIQLYCINPHNADANRITKPGWHSQPFKFRFIGVEKENWLYREINTRIQTTIINTKLNRPLRNQKVHATVIDLSTGEIERPLVKKTNVSGSTSFNFSTKIYWYKKQKYILKLVYITDSTKMLNTRRIIAINPWDFTFTHGFEIDNLENFQAICSTEKDLKQIGKLLTLSYKKLQKNITSEQLELIHKVLCHNTDTHDHFHDVKNSEETKKWVFAFSEFSKMLRKVFRHIHLPEDPPSANTLSTLFNHKFTRLNTIPKPNAYVHLFRSITKHPTTVLDFSLNRSVIYNTTIKITPRIVRMDSIAKGQQDKGPLRDGVYFLRLALLKNNQERKLGAVTMVSSMAHTSTANTQSDNPVNYTTSIYSCINKPKIKITDCITKDDFIMPPQDILVMARGGVIKANIQIPISEENLKFANSKNTLVFTIAPVDPDSVVCKDKSLTGLDCSTGKDYGTKFDWKQTLKTAHIAKPEHYDLLIYNYETPFIPSEWSNWNITQETGNNEKLEIEYDLKPHENKNEINLSFNWLKDTYNKLNALDSDIKKTDTITPSTHKEEEEEEEEEHTHVHNAISPNPKEDTQVCLNTNAQGKNLTIHHSNHNCVDNIKPLPDMSHPHINYFATQNALCTIPIGYSNLTPKACGAFTKVKDIETTFIENLNKQIATINTFKENMLKYPDYSSNQPRIISDKPLHHRILIDSKADAVKFRYKMNNLPVGKTLTTQNLQEVIHSNWQSPETLTTPQITFMHALCGFWFENFYTNQYIKAPLLEDAFKNTIKQTLYYKLRGIAPPSKTTDTAQTNMLQVDDMHQAIEELENLYTQNLIDMNMKGSIDDVHNWVTHQEEAYNTQSPFHQQLREKFNYLSHKSPFVSHALFGQKNTFLANVTDWFKGKNNTVSNAQNDFQLTAFLKEAQQHIPLNRMGITTAMLIDRTHPVQKCLRNPTHFFNFEKKIIVGQAGNHIQYIQGEQTRWVVAEEFLMNTQRDQGSNQDTSLSIGAALNILALPLMFTGVGLASTFIRSLATASAGRFAAFKGIRTRNTLLGAFGMASLLTIPSSTSYNYRTYSGTGKRRLLSYQINEQINLLADHIVVNIPLKKYHECLVVRPRDSAFESYQDTYEHIWSVKNKIVRVLYEQMGVLLCAEGTNPHFNITEDYYFIYPDYDINSITMDPRNYRNKPFMVNIRGQNEYTKLMKDLSCYLTKNTSALRKDTHCRDPQLEYNYMFNKGIEFAKNLRVGFDVPKLFHTTKPAPGVYSPPLHKTKDQPLRTTDTNMISSYLNWLSARKLMDADIEEFVRNTPPDDL